MRMVRSVQKFYDDNAILVEKEKIRLSRPKTAQSCIQTDIPIVAHTRTNYIEGSPMIVRTKKHFYELDFVFDCGKDGKRL